MSSGIGPPLLVSVVVIGRNEGARLGACLASVARMEKRGFSTEVIYVDSGSVDGSARLAERMGARVVELHPQRPTAALGRNAGWREATAEFVLFLDGDTVLAPEFVAESLRCFCDPAVAVVWGHRREMHPEHSIYNRVLDLDWIYPAGPSAFCGGDALFRREVLRLTGGFDDSLIAGEEPELCRRILAQGKVILHVDRAMTGHDLNIRHFHQYWRRATRAGHAYAEVSERFRGSAAPFWEAEVRRSQTQVLIAAAALALLLAAALALRSCWPFALGALVALLLVARTAWRARWKGGGWMTLILYGFHSQIQQIPIWWGQMRFRRVRKAGDRVGLVEYKR